MSRSIVLLAALVAGCSAPLDAASIKTLVDACERQNGQPTYYHSGAATSFTCKPKEGKP